MTLSTSLKHIAGGSLASLLIGLTGSVQGANDLNLSNTPLFLGDSVDPKHRKLADLARKAEANRKQLQKSIDTLQELLDYLRVCIKYQTFDLEATRRENDYLRKLLEEKNGGDG